MSDAFEQSLAEARERVLQQSTERHEVLLTKGKVLSVDEITLLPDKLRDYIHDLETPADKAGDIREIAFLTEQRDALVVEVKELQQEIERLTGQAA